MDFDIRRIQNPHMLAVSRRGRYLRWLDTGGAARRWYLRGNYLLYMALDPSMLDERAAAGWVPGMAGALGAMGGLPPAPGMQMDDGGFGGASADGRYGDTCQTGRQSDRRHHHTGILPKTFRTSRSQSSSSHRTHPGIPRRA